MIKERIYSLFFIFLATFFREFVERLIDEGSYENRGVLYTSTTGRLRDQNLKTIIDEIYNQRHWNQ